jgi:hypothetical protein
MNPLHLLKLEWGKYAPNGAFRFFVGLYAGSFVLVLYLARAIGKNVEATSEGSTNHPLQDLFIYPQNWEVLGCIGSWMNAFVLGSLGVFMITMEFSNRTLRQSVIFGLTRLEVAASKLVWAVALALAATFFYLLLGMGEEALNGDGLGSPPAGCLLSYFLQALGYLLLGTLVGLLIRQTALAILAFLAYVVFLETVLRWIFYLSVAKTRLLLFLPDQVLGALTPLPVPPSVHQLVYSNPATEPLSATEAVVGALVYLGLFAAFFFRRMVKSDL